MFDEVELDKNTRRNTEIFGELHDRHDELLDSIREYRKAYNKALVRVARVVAKKLGKPYKRPHIVYEITPKCILDYVSRKHPDIWK